MWELLARNVSWRKLAFICKFLISWTSLKSKLSKRGTKNSSSFQVLPFSVVSQSVVKEISSLPEAKLQGPKAGAKATQTFWPTILAVPGSPKRGPFPSQTGRSLWPPGSVALLPETAFRRDTVWFVNAYYIHPFMLQWKLFFSFPTLWFIYLALCPHLEKNAEMCI